MRVLERAIQFGASDPETRLWSERAKVFKSMQATAGMRAVANEIQRTAPLEAPRPSMESMTDTTTEVNVVKAPALGRADDDRDDEDELTRRPAPIPKAVQESAPQPRPPLYSSNTGTNMLALPARRRRRAERHPPEFPREEVPSKFNKDADTSPPFAPIGAAPLRSRRLRHAIRSAALGGARCQGKPLLRPWSRAR